MNGEEFAPLTNVYLTGFMAAGKSTVGLKLSKRLGWKFVDTDREIEIQSGLKVSELFERYSEKSFRDWEHRVIQQVSSKSCQVIALGGGSLLSEGNRIAIAASGVLIYLRARISTLVHRLSLDGGNRPLLEGKTDKVLLSHALSLFELRTPGYEAANLKIDTDELNQDQAADKICSLLDKRVFHE